MRIRFTGIASLVALLLTTAALAQDKERGGVWKWVDKDGVAHYSDQPGPNAVKVDLRIQTYSPPESISAAQPPRPQTKSAPKTYRSVSITSPQPEQTFQGEERVSIPLAAQSEPGLGAGDLIRFYVDGQPQGEASRSFRLSVQDLSRGAHTVRAGILTADGTTIIESVPVTFYVQQTSLFSPAQQNSPNAPRPVPTPLPSRP